jgi:hypothetical protein
VEEETPGFGLGRFDIKVKGNKAREGSNQRPKAADIDTQKKRLPIIRKGSQEDRRWHIGEPLAKENGRGFGGVRESALKELL